MKTLYIHIGYHKTATTSIQSFLANNRKNLLESGYLYPRTGAIDSAHHLLAIAINQNPAFLFMLKKEPIEYWADLKKEAVSSGAETVVLSSEEFSVIKDAGKLQHLHELVKDDFDVKIVVYLRRIDEYAESIYKQLVKFYGSRHQQPFDINADYVVNRIDCYQALMRWANIFGKENIKVRVFEKGQIINNPVYDFLDTVDYSGHLLNTEKTNIKQNFSISTKYTDLLRLVNANTDLSKIIHEKLVDFFVAMSGEETDDYSFLSQQHKEDLIAKSTPFDRKIATEFLGKEDGILYLAQPASTPQYQGIFGTDFDNYNVLSTIQKIFRDKQTTVEDLISKGQFQKDTKFQNSRVSGFCTACGKQSIFEFRKNLRDSGNCAECGASNRKRQIGFILRQHLGLPNYDCDLKIPAGCVLYNTEGKGALHQLLSANEGYVCSEYLDDHAKPGQFINGKRHEDLQQLSFSDNSIDIAISSDVFEHIPAAYKAHKEIFRVLRPGGVHIFTVPFDIRTYQDDVRAVMENGEIKHLKPPIYHGDPVKPSSGILVFRVFSIEMLTNLNEIGFEVFAYRLHSEDIGILGNNGLVFMAKKAAR